MHTFMCAATNINLPITKQQKNYFLGLTSTLKHEAKTFQSTFSLHST